MAYTALYRKKRPQTFHEVVGQAHVVRTLLNQLSAGHISHAYLFCGTRGTGKTTTARLFSRAVNCEHPHGGEPCNTCDVCLGILSERNLGVIEIDAASNNGVENIRDLRDEVRYPPTEGRYKVYIIDEAHMLTTSAFNALLKTLEEPPAHVIFILATTDPQKIPATILSRCQRYDFKRITATDMVNTIRGYLREENASVEDEALRYIASVSDGAMRDALSILDQCLSFYGGEYITLSKVLSLLGAVDRQVLFDFTEALARFDSGMVLTVIDGVVRDGRDIGQFTADLVRHFRDLLVASQISAHTDILDHSEEMVNRLKTQSTGMAHETLISYIRAFSELQNELRYTGHARMALEVCAIRLCHPSVWAQPEAIIARLAKLEQQMDARPETLPYPSGGDNAVPVTDRAAAEFSSVPHAEKHASLTPPTGYLSPSAVPTIEKTIKPAPAAAKVSVAAPAATMPNVPPTVLTPETIKAIQNGWPDFCRDFSNPLKSMLQICAAEAAGGMLQIIGNNEASIRFIKERQSLLQEKLVARFKLPSAPNLAFNVQDEYNKPQVENAADNDAWASFGEQMDINAAW